MSQRTCGDCAMCCKLLAIQELNKPPQQWCHYWRLHVGCAIYQARPAECERFNCLWLLGLLPDDLAPKKTRVVAYLDKEAMIILHEDQKGTATVRFAEPIRKWLEAGKRIVIVRGMQGELWSQNESRSNAETAAAR